MGYKRSTSMYDALMSGLSSLGDTAQGIAKNQSDLKLRAAQLKESEQNQQINAQTIAKNNETAAQALARKQLTGSLEDAGSLAPRAMDANTPANGNSLDFQAIQAAKKFDSEAKLWNLANQDREGFEPMTGEKLRKMTEEKAITANRADQAGIDKGINDDKAFDLDQRKGEAQIKKDNAIAESGRFTPIALEGGRAGAMNTKTGAITDTGEHVQPKGGANKQVVKAGDVLIPNLEPIPGVQITTDSLKKTKDAYAAYQAFKNQLDAYKDTVSKQGSELAGEKADNADAMVTDLGMKLKALQDLGVLNGRDWELMMKQIPGTTGIGASLKSAAYGAVGQDAFGPRLNVLSNSMDDKFKVFAETNGFRKAAQPGAAPGAGKVSDDDILKQLGL